MKLAIVGSAFYFIFDRIDQSELTSFHITPVQGFVLMLFSLFSWTFEIIKWKNLANHLQKTTGYQAIQQALSSHTLAIITPHRIGEYGGKSIYFENKKGALGLNFMGNFYQMLVTVFFGSMGCLIIALNYEILFFGYKSIFIILCILGLFLFLLYRNKKRFDKPLTFIRTISTALHRKTFFLSFLKYLIFSNQFYFLLVVFDVELHYFTLLPLIFSMYFLASIMPSIAIFDFAIKGSIAIYLFQLVSLSATTIATITFISWFLNHAIPAIIGSAFVFQFKQKLDYDID